MKRVLLVVLIALPVLSLAAKDFGVLLNGGGAYSDDGRDDTIDYHGTLVPWFSTPLGNGADVYASAGLSARYESEEWMFVPELLRTEFRFRAGESGTVTLGRMRYADPLGFIANGLFDGGRYVLDFANGSALGIGAWYTGFLYKKNANITMTMDDLAEYDTKLDYADFAGTYFAPRRLLVAVDWNHPGISELVRLQLSLIGQFDLSGNEALYHSQYLTAKAIVPVSQFVFEAGGVVELAEASEEYLISFAGEVGILWSPPTAITDRLSFLGRFSGGTVGDGETFAAFVPITTESQGSVLKEKLSGLSMLRLDYTARLHQQVSISLADSYFILSDLGSYRGKPDGRDGYFLGNELYGLVTWSPVSDLQIKAGGGVFLPSLGNADKDADPMWRIDLAVVLALF